MDYSKYGLSKTSASAADHDKGIIAAPDGSFYQIDGFSREQNDDLDTDKGESFSSSLQADAKAATNGDYDPTTFNTATDVENALRRLGGGEAKEEAAPEKYVPSERITTAKERVEKWESGALLDHNYNSEESADTEAEGNGEASSQSYLNDFKLNLREKAAKGELGKLK